MPVECEELESRLTEVVAGRASNTARTELAHHLEQCTSCRAEAQTLRPAMEFLNSIAVPDPGDEFWQDFPDVIGERIGDAQESARGSREYSARWPGLRHLMHVRLRFSVPAVPAAALFVVVVSGMLTIGMFSHRPTGEPTARLSSPTGDVTNGGTITGSEQLVRAPRTASPDRAQLPAELGLDEAARKKLMHAQEARLASIDRLQAQRRELLDGLRRELRTPDNDVALAQTLDALQRNGQGLAEADENYHKLLGRLLTPRQRALYLLANQGRVGDGPAKAVYDQGVSTHQNGVIENGGK